MNDRKFVLEDFLNLERASDRLFLNYYNFVFLVLQNSVLLMPWISESLKSFILV